MAKQKSKKIKDHPVTAYAKAVLTGEIVTGRLVKLACARHVRDLDEGPKRGLHFSADDADHAIGFFPEFLRHNEGRFANQPFELSPHQIFIVGSLFGWLKADGYRRYQTAYIEAGKGDGKTPLASGIALYGLTMDGEEGAEIFTAAVTRDQAAIAFRDCKHMAEKSIFADRLTIGENNIAYEETNSFIRPVSSEARSLDGKRVFFAIIDEIHEHRSPLVVSKISLGVKGRSQPLIYEITNSGYDRTSICWEHHEYSRQVLEQIYDDDSWFCYVCQLDTCKKCTDEGKSSPQDDCENCDHWWDERHWTKANPNLGQSITREYLSNKVSLARRLPSEASLIKRFNFCVWDESSSHWLPMDDWDACAAPTAEMRELLVVPGGYDALRLRHHLKGRRCFAGLDLADTSDTASLVLVFPPRKIPRKIDTDADGGIYNSDAPVSKRYFDDPFRPKDAPFRKQDVSAVDAELLDEPFYILPFIWIPEEMKKRTGKDRERFKSWISQGLLEGTPGNLIDYRYILKTIGQCRIDYDLQMLAFDRWGSSKIITDLCDDYGFSVDEKEAKNYGKPLLVQFGQGFANMSSPTKEFSNLVIAHKMIHGGHPVLRWAVGNVVINQDPAGNQKPDKGKSTEKIDAAVSGIMALDLAIRNPGEKGSIYEERDLVVL